MVKSSNITKTVVKSKDDISPYRVEKDLINGLLHLYEEGDNSIAWIATFKYYSDIELFVQEKLKQ